MLKQQIEQQIKDAMKSGNQMLVDTLRFLLSAVKNEEIAKQKEVEDEDVIAVVQKQIKQHRESIEAYQKAGRIELEQKERAELDILNKFLPQQMTEDEVKKIVSEVVSSLSEGDRNNFGKLMSAVMPKVKGKTDGTVVAKLVKEVLA